MVSGFWGLGFRLLGVQAFGPLGLLVSDSFLRLVSDVALLRF